MNVHPNDLGAGVHIMHILENHLGSAQFVDNKLLEAEIRHLNQFILAGNAAAINSGNPVAYQADIDARTANFSQMIGKIILASGLVTGTLIPIPTAGGYQWAVLTCGHIMECIDKIDNPAEEATFELSGKVPIPITSIRLFKRNGRESQMSYNGGMNFSPLNMAELGALARSLPRYDGDGDVAICYLGNINVGGAIINTQAYLNHCYPIAGFAFNPAANQINFTMGASAINFHFVNHLAEAQAISAMINGLAKNQNFVIGYAGFNPLSQTLSVARDGNLPLFPGFISVPVTTEYSFFHDAPTYSGMSGGPIFHFAPAAPGAAGALNTINVYGVVQGYNFGNVGAACTPSRCVGSFLQLNVL